MARAIWVLAIAAGEPAVACTFLSTEFKAGPSFRIEVAVPAFAPRPTAITLTRKGGAVVSAPILGSGIASFQDLPVGEYKVQWDDGTGSEPLGTIRVLASAPGNEVLKLPPYRPPVRTASLKGFLRAANQAHSERLRLEVRRTYTGPAVRRTTTAKAGAFDFSKVPAGLYVLSIATPNPLLGGDMKVLLDPHSPSRSLDLEFGSSSCGPWMRERSGTRSPTPAPGAN